MGRELLLRLELLQSRRKLLLGVKGLSLELLERTLVYMFGRLVLPPLSVPPTLLLQRLALGSVLAWLEGILALEQEGPVHDIRVHATEVFLVFALQLLPALPQVPGLGLHEFLEGAGLAQRLLQLGPHVLGEVLLLLHAVLLLS